MPTNGYDFLKDASQITGAEWAVLVERESGHWQVRAGHQLTRHRKEARSWIYIIYVRYN